MYSATTRAIKQSVGPISRRAVTNNFASTIASHRFLSINVPRSQQSTKLLNVAGNASLLRGFRRSYSVLSEEPEATLYDYKGIKAVATNPSAHPNSLIIDVREPIEFQEGHIPTAINIPFKTSPGALGLSAEDFVDQFGFDKPQADKELVFYCLGGVRSSAAEDLARTFGYKNRGNYVGSWEDWITHENAKN